MKDNLELVLMVLALILSYVHQRRMQFSIYIFCSFDHLVFTWCFSNKSELALKAAFKDKKQLVYHW